jgi:ribonuclease D
VADPAIETILHAASQDLEIFYDKTRTLPHGIFDTQVAAALLGMGEQPGYADLLRRVLDVRVKKQERVTDWSQRPLREAQIQYALNDVIYLHDLRDQLSTRLKRKGRLRWLAQELAHFEELEEYEIDHRRLWRRVSRHRSLDGKGLAVLRELADWRERSAARRNVPRNRVVTDDVLIDLSRRKPKAVEELQVLRRLHSREIQRSGEEILQAVQRGLKTPRTDWPKLPSIREDDPDILLTADLLSVFLRGITRKASIATSYVATKKDLVRFIERVKDGEDSADHLPLMKGWRYELAGRHLLAMLEGKVSLSVKAKNRHVQVMEKDPEES